MSQHTVDFAISYAGEDSAVAEALSARLRELGFECFMAGEQTHLLAGIDAEQFFDRLFTEAKVVLTLISRAYKEKEWTRFEWDVIRERPKPARYLPVKLDESVRILGLPSNIIYLTLQDGYEPVIRACVDRLLSYEAVLGERRETEFERILRAVRDNSKGALAQAYQLVRDKRSRDPLADTPIPTSHDFAPSYQVVSKEWSSFSMVRRLVLRVVVAPRLGTDALTWNLKHCAAIHFNAYKPDAIMVLAYLNEDASDITGPFSAGRCVFAPFGRWEAAQDGVAYNIPVSEFDYEIRIAER
jgi:hypothetical protein